MFWWVWRRFSLVEAELISLIYLHERMRAGGGNFRRMRDDGSHGDGQLRDELGGPLSFLSLFSSSSLVFLLVHLLQLHLQPPASRSWLRCFFRPPQAAATLPPTGVEAHASTKAFV